MLLVTPCWLGIAIAALLVIGSNLLKDLLADLGVERTHNRPRVSNGNPFSESEFRTMKYRPNDPGTFTDLDHARDQMASYVPWYNADHKHSGIASFLPEIHDGTVGSIRP